MIKIVRPKYLSPSAINSYRYCPRQFYLRYILGLKSKPKLCMIAGNIVHGSISHFLKNNVHALDSRLESDHYEALQKSIVKTFNKRWWSAGPQFERLEESPAEIKKAYLASRKQTRNWFELWYNRVLEEYDKCGDWNLAVVRAKPKSEISIRSDKFKLYCRIDILEDSGKIIITDLKTGKKYRSMKPADRLQLACCALAFFDQFGKMPDVVQAHYLAYDDGIEEIEVTESLLAEARMAIDQHNMLTQSSNIENYPCLCGGHCQKDFYPEDGEKPD